ncbi:MAG TPA: hypothetical protein PKZ36_00970 [Candidatus Paceibacterota bacterium]|nr:hypothetical protein [Candidatus Paceibacterota bacterium]HPT17963.1 hypothetical protein [Candidatus Paceibacterota bacterium]
MKIKFPKFKKNYENQNFKISPDIYWNILIVLFFIIIIAVFIFSFNLYKQTSVESEVTYQNISGKIEKEKKEKINRVLEYFSEREQKSNEILNSPAPVVDPSL